MVSSKFIAFALLATFLATASASKYHDPCQKAYSQCRFRFHGYRYHVPTFHIGGKNDVSFTPKIISRKSHERIGIVNSGASPAQFIFRHYSKPITHFGSQRFAPTTFKPYAFKYSMMSGIGHQTFQGNQLSVAKGKCVKVMINFYQILGPGHYPKTVTNINNAYECIVFKTK